MLYDGFGTSASNLGAGDHGKVAAPTHSSTQKAASHLGRRGRTTCSAQTNALREVPREIRRAPGKAKVYTTVRVGRDFGEREPAGSGRASRDAACSGRASRPTRTTRTAGQHRGCMCMCMWTCMCMCMCMHMCIIGREHRLVWHSRGPSDSAGKAAAARAAAAAARVMAVAG